MFTYSFVHRTSNIRRNDGLEIPPFDGEPNYEQYKLWVSAGNVTAPAPLPTQAEQFSAIERAFDKHIDDVAAARGYGRNGHSPVSPSEACKGFAGYPNQWQAEAIKFGQWSADCCARLIQGQADVIAGTRPMPTPAQAIAELPAMVW